MKGGWWGAALTTICAFAAHTVHAAPIRAVSPSTGIFLGNVVVGRTVLVEASGAGAEVSALVVPAAGFYSPTTNTLLGVVVPYVEKRLEFDRDGEETTRGLGDLTLIGHHRFWNRPARGYADQAAARLAVELPTGSTDRRVGLAVPEPVRRALQPGSGAPGVTFTLAAGREHYRYNLDLNVGYRLRTEHEGFRFGDEAFANVSLQRFLLPAWTRARRFEVLAALEFEFAHQERSRLDGRSVRDSGGDLLSIAPGLQWIATERILLEASFRLPVVQHVNGRQATLDHDLLVGFRIAF